MAPEPEANGAGMADAPEQWGAGGLVGDGRYRLTHRLGRGGMAEVFAAEDVRLGRTVAVKLLRADLAEDPVSKARFTREAQSVAGLNHHAVVAVYDSGEDKVGINTVPYIVMELVEGRTIRDLLMSAEAPGPEQALIIVSGVLEALAYSHQHGIVHRDIKPANVIITHAGAVKVMDFGIARALHGAQSTMTQTGMVMGTPQYLSPEQALGKAVDHRSDLYATGCLLYELLALRPPFIGETPLSVVYQHVQDAPVPPSDMSDGVPPELDGLVMRSLAKDPDDRFQSAEEMRGLVQYGLQMLQEQGSHTGTWNTGPVETHVGGAAAAGLAGAAALPHPDQGMTSQFGQSMLRPRSAEDGGFDGGYRDGNGGRGGRWKMWLFAALAVFAGGIVYALDQGKSKGEENQKGTTVTVTPSTPKENTPSESQPSEDEEEQPETSTGGHQNDDFTPDPDPTKSEPSTDPTPTETDSESPDPGTDTGGSVDGGTDGGPSTDPSDTSTTTDGGTDSAGTDGGAVDGGTTEGGVTEGGAAP
ncbi:protein kinase domain-containing protein [Streptomyces sp. SYSU K21746]